MKDKVLRLPIIENVQFANVTNKALEPESTVAVTIQLDANSGQVIQIPLTQHAYKGLLEMLALLPLAQEVLNTGEIDEDEPTRH